MDNPTLLVDINQWQTDFDPLILKQNNVAGAILAFNTYTGKLELNSNFISQYNKCLQTGIVVMPYMVYTPTISAQSYFNWLSINMPSGAKTLLVDTEIIVKSYSPSIYANKYAEFINLIKTKWNIISYTGEWFLPNLAYWPNDLNYWWSEFPNAFYPSNTQYWSWTDVRNALLNFSKPLNADASPAPISFWQFSGDKIVVPGSSSKMDLDVFFGIIDELIALAGNGGGVIDPIPTGDILIKSEQWYDGCLYEQWNVTTDHGIIHTHLLTFDTNKVEEFFVTPNPDTRHYVPDWLVLFPDMDIAINCDQFVGITMGGFNASEGKPYGLESRDNEAVVFIDSANNFLLKTPPILIPSNLWNAYAVPNVLVQSGQALQHIKDINATKGHRPRSASGKSADGSKKYILAVDGDETYDITSESGFDFIETGKFSIRHGANEAYMHDGGGSETLAKRNVDHSVYVVNNARGEDTVSRYPGVTLRRVANCLMVRMKNGTVIVPSISPSEQVILENTINVFNNGNMEVK